jgi:hypothetical protein
MRFQKKASRSVCIQVWKISRQETGRFRPSLRLDSGLLRLPFANPTSLMVKKEEAVLESGAGFLSSVLGTNALWRNLR